MWLNPQDLLGEELQHLVVSLSFFKNVYQTLISGFGIYVTI